jgi:hypothetical protein
VLAAAALAAAGCGGDDDDQTTEAASPTATGTTETGTTEGDRAPRTDERERTDAEREREQERTTPEDSPEKEEGGAGDEEPARSEARFTARRGRVTPTKVRVAPFIAVQVTVVSYERSLYKVRVGGKSVNVPPGGRGLINLDGLRPGKRYLGKVEPSGQTIRIEASAEPGP